MPLVRSSASNTQRRSTRVSVLYCMRPNFPWATRQDIVYHVQNQLDREDLDEGDRRVLKEQLDELLQNPDNKDVEKRQVKVLRALKDSLPGFYNNVVVPIVTPLITAWMKQEMALPPG